MFKEKKNEFSTGNDKKTQLSLLKINNPSSKSKNVIFGKNKSSSSLIHIEKGKSIINTNKGFQKSVTENKQTITNNLIRTQDINSHSNMIKNIINKTPINIIDHCEIKNSRTKNSLNKYRSNKNLKRISNLEERNKINLNIDQNENIQESKDVKKGIGFFNQQNSFKSNFVNIFKIKNEDQDLLISQMKYFRGKVNFFSKYNQ